MRSTIGRGISTSDHFSRVQQTPRIARGVLYSEFVGFAKLVEGGVILQRLFATNITMPKFESFTKPAGREEIRNDTEIREGRHETESIEWEAHLEQVKRIIERLLEQSMEVHIERPHAYSHGNLTYLDDYIILDKEGYELSYVFEFGHIKTPMEVRDPKGILLAQSWDQKHWVVGRYVSDIESGHDHDLKVGVVETAGEPKNVTIDNSMWEVYRGTERLDVDNKNLDLHRMIRYDAWRRLGLKGQEDYEYARFKDPESDAAKFYEQAVLREMGIERERRSVREASQPE
jgi:hypothetical protein